MERIHNVTDKDFGEQLKQVFRNAPLEQTIPGVDEFRLLMTYYQCAIMEIETKFNVLNQEFAMHNDRNPINSIQCRIKSGLSIREKLSRKGLEPSIETIESEINDIAGVRVVCSFTDDVYNLEKAFLAQDDIVLIKRKDYIKEPKPNGYRSLHLIVSVPIFLSNQKRFVKVEIQLRTVAMDAWASLEHQLKYKKDETDNSLDDMLFRCSELMNEFDGTMNGMYRNILD